MQSDARLDSCRENFVGLRSGISNTDFGKSIGNFLSPTPHVSNIPSIPNATNKQLLKWVSWRHAQALFWAEPPRQKRGESRSCSPPIPLRAALFWKGTGLCWCWDVKLTCQEGRNVSFQRPFSPSLPSSAFFWVHSVSVGRFRKPCARLECGYQYGVRVCRTERT